MRIRDRTSFSRISAFILMLVVGCDSSPDIDYDQLGLVDVSGHVTLDGQPLASAVVIFEDPTGRFSYGLTDEDGDYALQFDSQQQGVTPGEKMVRISTRRKIVGLNTAGGGEAPAGEAAGEGNQGGASTERVPVQYNKNSQLTVTVQPGDDQTFDFHLTTKNAGDHRGEGP